MHIPSSSFPRASATSAQHRAQKLSESFQGARRRRKEQQDKKNAEAAAGVTTSMEKTAVQIPAAGGPSGEIKPTECLPESKAEIAQVLPEVDFFLTCQH